MELTNELNIRFKIIERALEHLKAEVLTNPRAINNRLHACCILHYASLDALELIPHLVPNQGNERQA